MIDVDGLVFDHPCGQVLHGVSFVVRAGAVLALVGPEGAGKSTLMRCIAALETPGAGRITVAGLDTQADPRGVHGRIGYLPQRYGLYDGLSVRRCLLYAARARSLDAEAAPAAAEAAASQLGLAGVLERLAGALTWDQRQRLAIAQAIVHRPHVLLLDEPATELDAWERERLDGLIAGLAAGGMTLVISSAEPAELQGCCTEVLALEGGLIQGGGVSKPVAVQADAGAEVPPTSVLIRLAEPVDGLAARLGALGFTVEAASDVAATVALWGGVEAERAALARLVADGLPVAGFAAEASATPPAAP